MQASIPIQSPDEVEALLGVNDRHARLFRSEFNVAVTVRNGEFQLVGEQEDVAAARRVAEEVLKRFRSAGRIDAEEVELLLRAGGVGASVDSDEMLVRNRMHRNVVPRTEGQRRFVKAMNRSEVVFAIGPAGTGKTYLAVAMAVRQLRDGKVKKLTLTRPAVEAGEKLGFLPGTYEAKVNPYLRPLYDALYDLLDPAQIRKFAENDVIEVAPLAYMRGRTLSDSFVILDEAQNTTPGQMKMFLTRMGEGSRCVVTGDVTQIDLPNPAGSGLLHAARLLRRIKGVSFCHFDQGDIVRHPVVQRIVDAYEKERR
ncbi:MAG: PhoH family protein [Planctomycetota bacterium]